MNDEQLSNLAYMLLVLSGVGAVFVLKAVWAGVTEVIHTSKQPTPLGKTLRITGKVIGILWIVIMAAGAGLKGYKPPQHTPTTQHFKCSTPNACG